MSNDDYPQTLLRRLVAASMAAAPDDATRDYSEDFDKQPLSSADLLARAVRQATRTGDFLGDPASAAVESIVSRSKIDFLSSDLIADRDDDTL